MNAFDRCRKPPLENFEPVKRNNDTGSTTKKIIFSNESGKIVRVRGDDSRVMGGGGFLRPTDKDWERSGDAVQDVASLIRVFTLYKLSQHGGYEDN